MTYLTVLLAFSGLCQDDSRELNERLKRKRTERLVKQLSAEDVETREKAEQKLLEAGESALSALDRAGKSEDAELASRASRLSHVIRRQVRMRGLAPSPRRLSLDLKGVTLAEATAEVARKTGYSIDVTRKARAIRLDELTLTDATWWEACIALTRHLPTPVDQGAAHMQLWIPSRRGLTLGIGGPCQYKAAGPALASLYMSSSGSLTLGFYLEPSHDRLLGMRGALLAARDKDGREIELSSRFQRHSSGQLNVIFSGGRKLPEQLSEVRLGLAVIYPIKWASLELLPEEKWLKTSVGDMQISYTRGKEDDSTVLTLEAQGRHPGTDVADRMYFSTITIMDKAETQLRPSWKSVPRPKGELPSFARNYHFSSFDESVPLERIHRVVLRIPVEVESRTYEFTFRDVKRLRR